MFIKNSSENSTPHQDSLMTLQLKLEEEMIENGSERFFRNEEKEILRGNTSNTAGARFVIRSLIEPLEEAIKEFIAEAKSGKPGRKHSALPFLLGINPAALAFLTLKECVNTIAFQGEASVQSTARRLARAVANEKNLRNLLKTNPRAFQIILKEAEAHPSSAMRDKITAALMVKMTGIDMTTTEEVLVGCKLIDLAIISTGMFQLAGGSTASGRDCTTIRLTDAATTRIAEARGVFSILTPTFLPFIVPPKPWTSPKSGGSWSGALRDMRLVRSRDKRVNKMLADHDLSSVYEAVNAVQATAWTVNRRVLSVLVEAFETEKAISGLPERAPEAPPFPPEAVLASDKLKKLRAGNRRIDEKLDLDALLTPEEKASNQILKDWKKVASLAHTNKRKNTAKRLVIRRTLDVATRFSAYEEIYFPHHLDFRGRMYPFCSSLSPQGADFSKGLLTFANGKPIGNGAGPGWLAVHGANTYGVDKITLEARIEWVESHNDIIKQVAADPWSSPGLEFWGAADKPWQFLAWCFEWGGYQEQGATFVSCLPIAMDGSCNGLQHYSAVLRDPVGGAAVNLVPGPIPSDIYATVAARTLEKATALLCPDSPTCGVVDNLVKLKEFWLKHGIDCAEQAKKWLAFGIDRKLTKRPVMTLPYGSTQFSCREFIEEALMDKIAKGAVNLWDNPEDKFDNGLFRASLWLQPLVWQSIGETVKAAKDGMVWLQQCSAVAADDNQPIIWTLPDGFVVRQANRAYKTNRVETVLAGKLVKLSVRSDVEGAKMDKRIQGQGVAPNWVHSMDAAALRSYVRMASDNGITSFALVHDSYGTLATDVDVMLACLKEAFIDLYEAQDPLVQFRMDMIETLSEGAMDKLPPLPPRGDLDLAGIRKSDFFFA